MVGLPQHTLPWCCSQEEQPHTSCSEVVPRKSLQRTWLHNGLHCGGLTTSTVLSEMSSQGILLERSPIWANTRAMRDRIFYIYTCLFYFKKGEVKYNFVLVFESLAASWVTSLSAAVFSFCSYFYFSS